MTATIDHDRLAHIAHLDAGGHANIQDGACVMEACAYLAGEPWTDRPACACPVIAGYAMTLNDRMPDDQRQRLIPYVVRIAGSRATPEVEQRRAYLAATFAVKVFAPLALDARHQHDHAKTLRELPDITDVASAHAAADAAASLDAAAAARYAADADAAYAAAHAAHAAHAAAHAANAVKSAVWDEAMVCLDAMLAIAATGETGGRA